MAAHCIWQQRADVRELRYRRLLHCACRDTHEHEAWNHTDQSRVVLFVDFVRELPFPVSTLNNIMIWLMSRSSFVQEILENQRLQDQVRVET